MLAFDRYSIWRLSESLVWKWIRTIMNCMPRMQVWEKKLTLRAFCLTIRAMRPCAKSFHCKYSSKVLFWWRNSGCELSKSSRCSPLWDVTLLRLTYAWPGLNTFLVIAIFEKVQPWARWYVYPSLMGNWCRSTWIAERNYSMLKRNFTIPRSQRGRCLFVCNLLALGLSNLMHILLCNLFA